MARFYEFLSDIKWSWLVAVIGFIIFVLFEIIVNIIGRYEGVPHDERTNVYKSFLRNDVMACRVRRVLSEPVGVQTDLTEKITKIKFFLDQDTLAERQENFFKLDPKIAALLVSATDTSIAHGLIKEENERYGKLEIDWSRVWSATFGLWKLVTVICLLVWWWNQSYRMSYFPLKKWWFWGYMVLTYPWSWGIGFFLSVSLLLNLKSRLRSKRRQKKLETPYDEFCAGIMKGVGKLRRTWKEVFS